MKDKLGRILNDIKYECFRHGGDSFDIKDGLLLSYSWSEEYTARKILFCGYEWVLSGYDYRYDSMVEFENTLKELPMGLSYTRRDILKCDELPKVDPRKYQYSCARKCYETQFVIHVSKNYSSSTVATAGKSRTFIRDDLDANTLSRAYAFKSKVICKYPNLIKDLYSAYLKGVHDRFFYHIDVNNITKYGIAPCPSDYGDSPGLQVEYSKYGLKPLEEDFQILGVALAVTELGSSDLNGDEYFELELSPGWHVCISKIVKCIKPKLSEW